jgi:hypothetical protein
MSRIDIGFIAVMIMLQFPFVAVVEVMGIHSLFGFIFKKI